jgi:PBP1b-binding outer membrane lipoprotein LpoB
MTSVRRVLLAVLLGLAIVGCTQPVRESAAPDATAPTPEATTQTPVAPTPTPAPTEDYEY